jgi:hypothetical protein
VAIYQACPKHLRPIIMSTMAAMFGPVPLACRPSTHVLDQILCGGTMPVSFSDLQLAFEFVSSGGMREIEAYLDRHSGKIYWHSEFGDNDEELPDDIDDEKYIFGAGGHERSYFPHYLEPRKTSEKALVRSSRKFGSAASRPGASTTWCRRWACPAFEPSLQLVQRH